jgi:hypothetical protein
MWSWDSEVKRLGSDVVCAFLAILPCFATQPTIVGTGLYSALYGLELEMQARSAQCSLAYTCSNTLAWFSSLSAFRSVDCLDLFSWANSHNSNFSRGSNSTSMSRFGFPRIFLRSPACGWSICTVQTRLGCAITISALTANADLAPPHLSHRLISRTLLMRAQYHTTHYWSHFILPSTPKIPYAFMSKLCNFQQSWRKHSFQKSNFILYLLLVKGFLKRLLKNW